MMKKEKTYLVLFLSLLSTYIISQEWIYLDKDQVNENFIDIVSSGEEEFTFTVRLKGFFSEKIDSNGIIFNNLTLPDYHTLSEIGKPALPVFSKLICLPNKSDFKLVYNCNNYTQLKLGASLI
ncbi:MAG: hypothetical protein JXB49_27865 [Bacteroidales bacterium]|nr:hypothetical protein [Bacteroidales bacterium]